MIFQKRKNFKVLNETKKIHMQKKDLTRENLLEFSLLFIMIFYGGAIKNNIESISNNNFSNPENEKLKSILIDLIKSNKTKKRLKMKL